MIEKKSFVMALKRALQTGSFNYVGQEATEFPHQIWHIDDVKIDDQNWWQCNPIIKVDVSNNQITSIPGGIAQLKDLQLLRMKNNLVKEIPPSMIELNTLKSIDLGKNRLVVLPENLSEWKSLVQANFSQNSLQYCPNLHHLQSLEVLHLNDNKLKALPMLGSGIRRLQSSANKITQIRRNNFQLCHNLEHLNLAKNLIQRIEENSFSNAKNMISIELKENRLLSFSQMPRSSKLDSVSLAFNRLTEFSYFDHCPSLTILILADNKIKKLSRDIIKLAKLKTLDLTNNDLSDLPCEIGFINSLVRIQVEGNPLKTIRQSIRTGGTNVIKKYLKDKMDPNEKAQIQKRTQTTFQKVNEGQYWSKLLYQFTQNNQLILRKMDLAQLNQIIYEKQLKGINISENKIHNIQNTIGKLHTLRYFIANNNQLQQLPLALSELPSLQHIQVKHNKISQFGGEGYKMLSYLDLSANRLPYIPKTIIRLGRVRTLHLAYNQIGDLQCLWGVNVLPQLQILDVSNNRVSQISDGIYTKINLNYLNIQNNNLSKLPTIIGFMKLSGCKIDGNPLKLIKRAVIDKGTIAILQHLRNKHTGPQPAPIKVEKPMEPEYVVEKSTYPYETEPVMKVQEPQKNQANQQLKKQKIRDLQAQINKIQNQLDTSMSMNTMQKTQKKKQMQALMIQRNKLMKQ